MNEDKELPAQPKEYPIGTIPPETEIPAIAKAIVNLQQRMSDVSGGTVTPRESMLIEDLLKKGLVFFVQSTDGRVIRSFYLQPLEGQENTYRLGGMSSEVKDQKFPTMVARELARLRDRTILLFAPKNHGAFYKRQDFTELTPAQLRDEHPNLFSAYQTSSDIHPTDNEHCYYLRIAS